MLSTQLNLENLAIRINDIRTLLIATGIEKGLDSMETLKYSQELDDLIIQYQLQSRKSN
ncbi:aspartyl-phosphate phosphatase Spo0E family protein [Domibacillus mangrovi]|uniref:Spo0E family sporulation regulatory protein-aspartic acid phosphatase n=1 Tax=Domibacillus mangrovi TaxID=1714354 RepID=A0A1Q5P3V1_9BACI|nr:aspartyl-phosphate phosphatase Spo0E family protein [Domibacillus mangrovi]OKL36878.1 hypothetical protein BLL40_09170 [Domibacillus mangrovi]